MAPPLHSGGRSLRAAWERQQRAAELAACVARIPQLSRAKPAFFAAQLKPVLAALRQAAAAAQEEGGQEGGAEAAEGGQQAQEQHGSSAHAQLAAAATHLRRLAGIDRHAGANASLLLCLLLGTAALGDEPQLQGGHLAQLCTNLGWQGLLLEVLLLFLAQQWPGQGAWLSELVAAAATAAAAASSDAQQRAAVEQAAACLACHTQQQLEGYSSGGGWGATQQALVAGMEALQHLLLAAPTVVAAPGAAAALQQLQASADASMAGLMQAMQAPGEQQAGRQVVFQQLCQLRARLMLAFAGAEAAAADDGSIAAAAAQAATAAERPHVMPEGLGQPSAAQAWRSILLMPPDVAAAAAAAAARGSAAGGGGSPMTLSRQQLVAAWVAATSYLRASASSDTSSRQAGIPSGSGGGGGGGGATPGEQPAFQSEIPGLHGVRFEPPKLFAVGSCGSDAASCEAAADAAAEGVAHEPDCLGPAHLTLTALHLAQQVAAGTASRAASAAAGAAEGGAAAAPALAWPLLLELASAAAATATAPEARQHLLLLLLHGRQAWLCQLREALAADAELQRSCRRELVAVANRLASEAGAGGRGAPAVVHGQERRWRTAAAVAALLPHALLCPAAVLERLVKEAVVQAGEQVDLLLDVLHEMAPLAGYRPQPHQPPLLVTLLARLLRPGERGRAAAALDTPGSRDAFLQLVAGLCGCRPTATGKAAAAAAAPGGQQPLLSAAAVLEHVVSPALQLQQREGHVAAQGDLLLPLQLTQLLAGTLPAAAAAGTPAAGAAAAAQQPGQQLAGLRPQLQALLDLGSRRIDRTPAALQVSLETFELAAAILQQTGSNSTTADASAEAAAAGYFRQQLQAAGQPGAGAQAQQQVAQLRQRLVQLLAALLPCATAAEAAGLLQAALPGAIQELMLPPAAKQQAGGRVLPGAHAAAVEAACRAVHALALAPGQAPIEGEEPAEAADAAIAAATAAAVAAGPSALRQLAVERALQHLTQHCASLAAARATEAAAPAAQLAQQLRLQPAEAQALGLRCVRELCQLVGALQHGGYDCSTLQVGLLQLARQLLAPPAAAQPDASAGVAAAAPGATQQQRQQLASSAQLRQQLEAVAAGLPEGRLRDLLLLGIQQAASE